MCGDGTRGRPRGHGQSIAVSVHGHGAAGGGIRVDGARLTVQVFNPLRALMHHALGRHDA